MLFVTKMSVIFSVLTAIFSVLTAIFSVLTANLPVLTAIYFVGLLSILLSPYPSPDQPRLTVHVLARALGLHLALSPPWDYALGLRPGTTPWDYALGPPA